MGFPKGAAEEMVLAAFRQSSARYFARSQPEYLAEVEAKIEEARKRLPPPTSAYPPSTAKAPPSKGASSGPSAEAKIEEARKRLPPPTS